MSICLSMIVKDEAHVIARCLTSVLPWIDAWVICDTGSTDDTCERIAESMVGLPGLIYHHKWKDFASNRNLALAAARSMGCDYILTIDADEWLTVTTPHAFTGLDAPGYLINFSHSGGSFTRMGLVRADLPWFWSGVLHETLEYPDTRPVSFLPGVQYETAQDGARSKDTHKIFHEIGQLEDLLAAQPEETRYWYFYAQALKAYGLTERAIAAFTQRAGDPGGNEDEIWFSYYQIGWLQMVEHQWDAAMVAYTRASELAPERAEIWFWWGMGHLERQEYTEAAACLQLASLCQKPPYGFLIEDSIYDYFALTNYAIALALAQDTQRAAIMAQQALCLPLLPDAQRAGLTQMLSDLQQPETRRGATR